MEMDGVIIKEINDSVISNNLQILKDHKEKSHLYSILCSKASLYYYYTKLGFDIPLILSSSVLTYINSNNDEKLIIYMKIINPIFNIITAILLGVHNIFQFESKSTQLKSNSIKFQKLNQLIENKIANNCITEDVVTNIIEQYDNIQEDCMNIPKHICKSVKKKYVENNCTNKRKLPIILQ